MRAAPGRANAVALLGGLRAERRPNVATKPAAKRLDLEAMSNREVLRELCRIYGDLLERLSNYADALAAEHVGHEDVDESVPDDEFDAIYDQAVGLVSRIQEANHAFTYGNGSLKTRDGADWNWGLDTYKKKFKQRAVAGLAASDAR
jgi:hypothetical protein